MHELVEHTADLEVRVVSATLDGLFAETGVALFEIIAGDLSQIHPRVTQSFTIPAATPEEMLHELLRSLHAAFEIDRMLLRDIDVRRRHGRLHAVARGEPFVAARHQLAHEIKGVTRHRFTVRSTPAGWEATFVVDV